MQILNLNTPEEIASAFDVFAELRPHWTQKEHFIQQVLEQRKEGYQMIAIEENGVIVAGAGFRFLTTLAWGKIIYIDDLITQESHRGKGYAKILLTHFKQLARSLSCTQIHLDTGYTRHTAHKVYLKEGFEFMAHHLRFMVQEAKTQAAS